MNERADRLRELLEANVRDRDAAGRGLDHYGEGEHGYAEAYAHFGRAARALGDDDLAERCADWLRDRTPPWGLPWDWRGAPAGSGFVTTTVAGMHLLFDLGEDPDLAWVAEHALRYGDKRHPAGKELVWNSVAQAAGLLARGGRHTVLVDALVADLDDALYHGLFPYSVEAPHFFEQHQAMVQEGLLLTEHPVALDLVERSLHATWRHLFLEEPIGRVSVDRSEMMWSQHLALQAWVFAEAGYTERAAALEDLVLDRHVAEDGSILAWPGGPKSVRMAAATLSALARIS